MPPIRRIFSKPVVAASVVALACCSSDETTATDESGASSLGDGVYVMGADGTNIVRLAALERPNAPLAHVKYSFIERANDVFQFAFVPDDEGSLYVFDATLGAAPFSSGRPTLKLRREPGSSLNGPAYCSQRNELAFGHVRDTYVGIELIDADALASLPASTVAEARSSANVRTLASSSMQIHTDLTCGNASEGVVYNGFDCTGTKGVEDCLAFGTAVTSIQRKTKDEIPADRLSFPEADPKIAASPRRPRATPIGDNGPSVFVDTAGATHLVFERAYTTNETFENPNLASEFKEWGFSTLVYKRIVGDAAAAKEYVVDFRHWLPRPADHVSFNASDVRVRGETVEIAALAVFKTPNASTSIDEDVFVGIVRAEFDVKDLGDDPVIVLDPARVHGVLSFGTFTCHVWNTYGFAPNGEVDIYGVASPRFVDDASGHALLTFSAYRGHFGRLDGEDVTFGERDRMPRAAFVASICAPTK